MKKSVYNKNAIVEVTKELTFDSAHFLENYVGPCSNLHGHTFKLHVTVRGKLNDQGMVLDFKEVKQSINESIVYDFDHSTLNEILEFNPTAENMVVYIFEILSEVIPARLDIPVEVVSVKLWETPTSYAEYKGDYTPIVVREGE